MLTLRLGARRTISEKKGGNKKKSLGTAAKWEGLGKTEPIAERKRFRKSSINVRKNETERGNC